MFKKLFAALGTKNPPDASAEDLGLHAPYPEQHLNYLYNLLFCDDLALFMSRDTGPQTGVWALLSAHEIDTEALLRFAEDDNNEGRTRALAYNRLRALHVQVPVKKLLGVIVEVALQEGLDVLAAFSEGGVRYLNRSGKVAVVEDQNHPIAHMAKEFVLASQSVIDKIGPWEEQRLPAPKSGNVRLTFLVSDGLYFGEGPFAILHEDDMAGPILSRAARLLQAVTESALQSGQDGATTSV